MILFSLINPATPLVTYGGAILILLFSILLLLEHNQQSRPSEKSISNSGNVLSIFNALLAIVIIVNSRPIDFWLSLLLVLFVVVALSLLIKIGSKSFRVPRIIILFLVVFVYAIWVVFYCQHDLYGVQITAMLNTTLSDQSGAASNDRLVTELWEKNIAAAFKEKTGITVIIKGVDPVPNKRLPKFQKILDPSHSTNSEKNEVDNVDVFAIDVIWPKILANYAEDLTPHFKKDLQRFISAVVENNTVNQKLVAVPWYIDIGLLYYRQDLLNQYGEKPPQTWEELETIAKKIQDAERKDKNPSIWGFIWQGKENEGLTCNALEWQASHGGGIIIDNESKVDFSLGAVTAFDRARKWIQESKITPPDVLEYGQGDLLNVWNQRNAVFMRDWPSAYRASQVTNSSIEPGEIGVSELPRGNGSGARHVSTLGGWELMVNKNSKGKKRDAAIKFVEFLSKDVEPINSPSLDNLSAPVSLAVKAGKLPALIELYDLPEVRKALPYIDDLSVKDLFTDNSLTHAESQIVRRPSTLTGKKYTAVSETYFKNVHKILEGLSDPKDAIKIMKEEIKVILAALK